MEKKSRESKWKKFETLESALMPYVKEYGGLPNCGYFKRNNRKDIMCAIYKHGGPKKVAKKMNIEIIQTKKQQNNCYVPIGYWQSWDNFKKELQPFIEKYGTIPSYNVMKEEGKGSLSDAFRYFGGFKAVRERLGLPKLYENSRTQPNGYYGNLENLKKVLQPLIDKYGTVPSATVIQAEIGYSPKSAIEKYHGGYKNIRKLLGLKETFYMKKQTGIGSYRKKALSQMDHKCYICGFSAMVLVHHLDEDRCNNNILNLIILCRNHHGMIHKKQIKNIEEYRDEYESRYKREEYE